MRKSACGKLVMKFVQIDSAIHPKTNLGTIHSFVSLLEHKCCLVNLGMKELAIVFGRFAQLNLMIIISQYWVCGTIDVNLNELEYLAVRLNPFECRRLIAALHYNTYELPNSLSGAERNVDDEIPCIGHLLHWNSSPLEGKGKTHEVLARRLRQINRNDLADWLGKSAFTQLGKDLDKAIAKPFGEIGKEDTEIPYPITLVPPENHAKGNLWVQFDIVLLAILLGLLATLLVIICATICNQIGKRFRTIKYKKLNQQGIQNENKDMEGRIKTKFANIGEEINLVHMDIDTVSEFD